MTHSEKAPLDGESFVHVAAVSDPQDQYEQYSVPDRVDDPPIADSDAPRFDAAQLFTAGRSRIICELVDRGFDSPADGWPGNVPPPTHVG